MAKNKLTELKRKGAIDRDLSCQVEVVLFRDNRDLFPYFAGRKSQRPADGSVQLPYEINRSRDGIKKTNCTVLHFYKHV